MFRYLRPSILMVLASASCGRLVYDPIDGGIDEGAKEGVNLDAADGSRPSDATDTTTPGDTTDASSGVTVSQVEVPQSIDPGATVDISISFTGPANAIFRFAIVAASGGGSFDPFEGLAGLDASGAALLKVRYTAPSTVGGFEHRVVVDLGAAQRSFGTVVKQSQIRIGYPDPQVWWTEFPQLKLLAFAIQVTEPVTLLRFGLRAHSLPVGAVHCRMALYDAAGMLPYMLRIAGPVMTIVPGQNEAEIPGGSADSSLAPGEYWLGMACDDIVNITSGSTETEYRWMSVSNVDSLPSTFETSAVNPTHFQDFALYIVAGT